ncbi:MAG TPA: hypothetical protein VKU00_12595 [Chthonomonadaceae bacterium]|nr:hypothetical protein [Chthonomonadaceae bacterium]
MKRLLFTVAVLATAFATITTVGPARADTETIILQAQGHPYLVDFQSLCNKRGDLRCSCTHDGLNKAFTLWLRQEHPSAYSASVQQLLAKRNAPSAEKACRP